MHKISFLVKPLEEASGGGKFWNLAPRPSGMFLHLWAGGSRVSFAATSPHYGLDGML